MKTYFISDGQKFRNNQFKRTSLNADHRNYLRKITKWTCPIWVYFSRIEDDYRILHKPMTIKQLSHHV